MTDTIIIAVVGALVSRLTRVIQKKYNVSTRLILTALAFIAWLAYTIFIQFVPEAVQENIIMFITKTVWSALLIHEFFTRQVIDWETIKLDIEEKWKDTNKSDQWEPIRDIYPVFEDHLEELEDEQFWWAEEKDDPEDWIMWEDRPNTPQITLQDLHPAKNTFNKSKIQYNQTKEAWKNTCTLVASMWAISDLEDKRVSAEEIVEVVETAKAKWFDHSRWWYTADATNHVRLTINKLRNIGLIRLGFPMSDIETLKKVQDLWYTVVVWYRWGKGYNADRNEDGVVDRLHTDNTYWHLVRLFNKIVDNYFGTKWNIYENRVIQEQLKKWTWHKYGYIFVNPDHAPGDTLKKKIYDFRETRKTTHDLIRIKWPIALWPKRIAKTAERATIGWKNVVMYQGMRHQIIELKKR